jgi:hypothetical protein
MPPTVTCTDGANRLYVRISAPQHGASYHANQRGTANVANANANANAGNETK